MPECAWQDEGRGSDAASDRWQLHKGRLRRTGWDPHAIPAARYTAAAICLLAGARRAVNAGVLPGLSHRGSCWWWHFLVVDPRFDSHGAAAVPGRDSARCWRWASPIARAASRAGSGPAGCRVADRPSAEKMPDDGAGWQRPDLVRLASAGKEKGPAQHDSPFGRTDRTGPIAVIPALGLAFGSFLRRSPGLVHGASTGR